MTDIDEIKKRVAELPSSLIYSKFLGIQALATKPMVEEFNFAIRDIKALADDHTTD